MMRQRPSVGCFAVIRAQGARVLESHCISIICLKEKYHLNLETDQVMISLGYGDCDSV